MAKVSSPTNYAFIRKYVGPHLAFIIERSTNQNVMVYEGHVKGQDQHKRLSSSEPLKAYWIDLDPESTGRSVAETMKHKTFVEDIKSGIKIWEHRGYGFSTQPMPHSSSYKIIMNAVPNRDIYMSYLPEKDLILTKTNIRGQMCHLRRIFVQVDGITPEYVIFEGTTLEKPYSPLSEKITS